MSISARVRSLAGRASGSGTAAVSEDVRDTWTLVRRYVVQETVEPLRGLGRTLAYGLAGAILCGVGVIFALLGILRVLQTETGSVFYGNWSFVPYVITGLVGALILYGLYLAGTRAMNTIREEL